MTEINKLDSSTGTSTVEIVDERLPKKIREELRELFNEHTESTDVMQFRYWTSAIHSYIMMIFNSKLDNPQLAQQYINIISFSGNINQVIKKINNNDKETLIFTLVALSLRKQAVETMLETNEINRELYQILNDEIETAVNQLISKSSKETIIDFMEKLMDNSADRDSKESRVNEITQAFLTTELKNGNKTAEKIIQRYLQLKPENRSRIFDREFFSFQGESLAGFLIKGGFYDFIAENMPNASTFSFLTTKDRIIRTFNNLQENPIMMEKTYFEQISLNDSEAKIEFDERINSTVLSHAIANFINIEKQIPQNSEQTQKALDCVANLLDKLNRHIEELSREQDETKRRKGFEEINYLLNTPILVDSMHFTTIADFLQEFDPQNPTIATSLKNLGIGTNVSPHGIKLHTLSEMNEIVRSQPEKFNTQIIAGMISQTNIGKIKKAVNSSEITLILQEYISIKNGKIVINEDGLEELLTLAQDDRELTSKLELNIWTIVAETYTKAGFSGHHIIAMQKWLTSKNYRLAKVYLEHEQSSLHTSLEKENLNPKILGNLEVNKTYFPTIYPVLTKTTKQGVTKIRSPEVLNELTRRRGFFGLGKRICDRKTPKENEKKLINRVLTEGEFDDIRSYEILLKNANSNDKRVSILNRALKLKEFSSSELCMNSLKRILLDKKVSNKNKEVLLNSVNKENREKLVLNLLTSMSDKELVYFLNNVKIPENILGYESILKHINKRLNNKTSFIGKTISENLNENANALLSKLYTQQKDSESEEKDEDFISIHTDSTPKKSKEEIEKLIGSPIKQADESVPPVIYFLNTCGDFENQAIFLARRAKLTKTQATKLFNALNSEAIDIRSEFLRALLTNPSVNKDKDIANFIIESTRKTQDAELWREAVECSKKAEKANDPELVRKITTLTARAK